MRLLIAYSVCAIYVLNIYSSAAYASTDDILVKELLIEVVDREISIDCEVRYAVDDKVKTALSNGIEVSFILDLALRLERDIWPDSTLVKVAREFRVKYHALSKQYVVVAVENDDERSFPDLYSAFYHIGHLQNVVLANIDVLELDQQYYIWARARLQSERLPLPLRIKSYFSPDWRPTSGWTAWPM